MSKSLLRHLLLSWIVAASSAHAAWSQMSFTEVSADAGVVYTQHVPVAEPNCFFTTLCGVERMTGGAAAADVDGDGDVDLFVTRLDASDILFVNQGDGIFTDGSVGAGFSGFLTQSNGVAFGDVDGDGDEDLILTVVGEASDPANNRNYLFVNDGHGVFSEVAVERGLADVGTDERAGQSVALGDYDGDGYLDVHVTDWLVGAPHQALFLNRGAAQPGYFDDVTAVAGVDDSLIRGFASAFVDLDDDGRQDLAIAGDFGTSRLYWNSGGGIFTDGTAAAGVGDDENGMGSAFGDYDGDGDLDWFVTSIHDPAQTCETENCNWGYSGNRLYRYDGARKFSDATDASGVRAGFWGWGTAFFDADLDGDLDLVMTNGVDFPGTNVDDAWVSDSMRLWENDGSGTMSEVSAVSGISDTGSGKGLLTFDYDADGDLDLFVVNNGGTPSLYRNDTPAAGNSWLRVVLRGRPGITIYGTRVYVWTHDLTEAPQLRVVGADAHFLAQGERALHFGLGAGVTSVRKVRVEFPDGAVSSWSHSPPDLTLTFTVAPHRSCGLIGIEVLAVIAWVARRRRRLSS
ncbi:MAG: CRTAC1 family protein [Deltaproteobacteria bacterium]|nr:CRTAC1 family protein [Deltaproteobacteria bacterium]